MLSAPSAFVVVGGVLEGQFVRVRAVPTATVGFWP